MNKLRLREVSHLPILFVVMAADVLAFAPQTWNFSRARFCLPHLSTLNPHLAQRSAQRASGYIVVSSLSRVQLFYDPMDCSPPGSSVHGISQARILKWVAIPYSKGSSQLRDGTQVSCNGRQIFFSH